MLKIQRKFSNPKKHPFDEVSWGIRHVEIKGKEGIIYQGDVEFPETWSDLATTVTAAKYFKIPPGSTTREFSLKQLIRRVCDTITDGGKSFGYFDDENAENFDKDLKWLLLHQRLAFNSPVYFNCGLVPNPQLSACFILGVEDSIESMLELQDAEVRLFKAGSGAGTNYGRVRGKGEPVSRGGIASGAVSFMSGPDAWAGVIQSGGATRRAAKMVALDVDHPDIEQFITIKAEEEKKAKFLIENGWESGMEGNIYSRLQFQNSNLSVMVTDEFMKAVRDDKEFELKARGQGKNRKVKARDLFKSIAASAHSCGDPGIQFYDTINRAHTYPDAGPIRSSNPCGEFLWTDNSACNLASIKLPAGPLPNETYIQDVTRIAIIAQDIICGIASYPTAKIEANSKKYRPLGLGFTNLGAHLMTLHLPYGNVSSVEYARSLARELSDAALKASGELRDALGSNLGPYPYRNAQLTLMAPAGTISYMLDADTTGIEPDYALVKEKTLAGGGVLKYTSKAVEAVVSDYFTDKPMGEEKFHQVMEYIKENNTVVGAPHLPRELYPIFKCATAGNPAGELTWEEHIEMMALIQAVIHGGISKTVNLPESVTVEDIEQIYMTAWAKGLKSLTVYRQNSKGAQPLKSAQKKERPADEFPSPPEVKRFSLPHHRKAEIVKFSINNQHDGFIIFGKYPDGYPAETFIQMSKAGSTVNGLMATVGILISTALQHGIPVSTITEKLSHIQFDPMGWTGDEDVRHASSPVDFLARKMNALFGDSPEKEKIEKIEKIEVKPELVKEKECIDGGPPCTLCGSITTRAGSCFRCSNCGSTTGCN